MGLYEQMEDEIIADIARRVKKTGRYTETAELMAKSMVEQGYSAEKIQAEVMKIIRADKAYQMAVAENTKAYKQEVQDIIKRTVKEAKEAGDELTAEAGNMAWNNDLSMWQEHGADLKKPNSMSQLISAFQKQTAGQLRNLTKSTGFKNTVFSTTGVLNAYQREMDLALLKVSTGTFSYDQAVNDCVHRLAQSGLRSIDYANGRSYQLDTAVRMSVRTGLSQLSGKVMEANLESSGQDLVITSQHIGSRPEHVPWQNKVFSYSGKNKKYPDFFKSTGYGTATGLKGVNCTHEFYPFWEGADFVPDDIEEPKPVKINGKTYDYYQVMQKQRQMERNIRATKREIEAQRAIGGDAAELQSKLRKQTADYRQFSAAAGVKVKNNRLRVVNGSSNLIKTSAYKKCSTSIRYNNPNGYYASIPKNWKIIDSDNNALKNTNPKFRTESGYDLNCPNCACAYEMRKRGYDVIARPYVSGGSHYLNMHPESAWEEAVIIECSGKNDIIKLLTETENDARFEVAYMRNHGGGHVIIAEKENGYIHFLDVQSGNEIDGSCLDKKNINSIKCFRIDNLEVSQHGVTACEKGD